MSAALLLALISAWLVGSVVACLFACALSALISRREE